MAISKKRDQKLTRIAASKSTSYKKERRVTWHKDVVTSQWKEPLLSRSPRQKRKELGSTKSESSDIAPKSCLYFRTSTPKKKTCREELSFKKMNSHENTNEEHSKRPSNWCSQQHVSTETAKVPVHPLLAEQLHYMQCNGLIPEELIKAKQDGWEASRYAPMVSPKCEEKGIQMRQSRRITVEL